MPVRSQFRPGGVDGKDAGGEAAEAGVLATSDPVLDTGVSAVAGLQILDRTLSGRGVGGQNLVAEPFDGVEQGQLRAGTWDLPAHDEPDAGGIAAVRDQAGDLGDLRPVALVTVGVSAV